MGLAEFTITFSFENRAAAPSKQRGSRFPNTGQVHPLRSSPGTWGGGKGVVSIHKSPELSEGHIGWNRGKS